MMHVSNVFAVLSFLLASSVTAYPTENLQKRAPWSQDCEKCFVDCVGGCISGFSIHSRVSINDMSTLNMCGTDCALQGRCHKITVGGGKRQEAGLITDSMKNRGLVDGLGQDSPGSSS